MAEELQKKGMRKFAFFMVAFAAICLLLGLDKLNVEGFVSCFWAIVIGFGGGNVGEHASNAFAQRGKL